MPWASRPIPVPARQHYSISSDRSAQTRPKPSGQHSQAPTQEAANLGPVAALTSATLAVVLSLLIPVLLTRARWLYRAPVAAVVLWQGVALAAVLAAIGAVLAT